VAVDRDESATAPSASGGATHPEFTYDAFVSYSHQDDGDLAPALQVALQRFAKPWYQLRALRVFRDEASLTANPALWASIEQALARSRWFVLLASAGAARSRWVNRELQWWLENRSPERILLVATTPGLRWDQALGDWAADAPVPAALRGVFTQEPRVADLAGVARADRRLRLPEDRVADVAAPVRGTTKDELIGDHLRERRRSRRLVSGAVTGLIVLTVAAVAASVLAVGQRNAARDQARVALSRELAARATADLPGNPEEGLSLALRAVRINPDESAEQALRLALAQDRLRMVIRSGTGSATVAAWNAARAQVAVTAPHDSVALWNTATGRLSQVLSTARGVTQILYAPDGARLAVVSSAGYVSMWNISASGMASPVSTSRLNALIRATAAPGSRAYPGLLLHGAWAGKSGGEFDVFAPGLSGILAFDAGTGAAVPLDRTPVAGVLDAVPDPAGSRLLVEGGTFNYIVSAVTGHRTRLSPPPYSLAPGPACWFPDGSAVVISTTEEVGGPEQVYAAANGALVAHLRTPAAPSTAVACSAGSPDPWMAAGDESGNVILRLARGTIVPLYGHSDAISAMASSPDGHYLATASRDGTARIWDARTGRPVTVLASDGAPILDVQFGPSAGLALTVDRLGLVRIWDTGVGEPVTELRDPPQGQAVALGFTQGGQQVAGADLVSSAGAAARITSVSALAWSARSGQLLRRVSLPGMAESAIPCSTSLEFVGGMGALPILPGSNCGTPPPPDLVLAVPVTRPGTENPDQAVIELLALAMSPDGRYLAYARFHSVALLAAGGHQIAALHLGGTPTGLSFGAGSRDLLVMTDSAIYLWRPFSGRPPLVIPQSSPPIDVALSESADRLAVAGGGRTVTVWSTITGALIRAFRPASSADTIPSVPLRVAITANGDVVASGNSDGTVSLWNVAARKRITVKLSDFPIIELRSAAGGSRLLAVDRPQVASGVLPPGTGQVLNSATGRVLAAYESPGPAAPNLNPGAALSADGNFLLGGVLGLAPTPPGGFAAVYQVSPGQTMADLQAAPESRARSYSESPAQPWSPGGNQVLFGTGIYPCDACGLPATLQAAARSRNAWSRPLSATSDHPPATNPYG
jgi:WD40 repeat protein